MTQNWEDCEVFEVDAEEPSAGTVVKFRNGSSPMLLRPYSEVLHALQQAGWEAVEEGYQDGFVDSGSRVTHLQRPLMPGRPVDDILDILHDI